MERLLWVIMIAALSVIGLCIFGIVSRDNPIVEIATDIVCDVTGDNVCEQIEDMEDPGEAV